MAESCGCAGCAAYDADGPQLTRRAAPSSPARRACASVGLMVSLSFLERRNHYKLYYSTRVTGTLQHWETGRQAITGVVPVETASPVAAEGRGTRAEMMHEDAPGAFWGPRFGITQCPGGRG